MSKLRRLKDHAKISDNSLNPIPSVAENRQISATGHQARARSRWRQGSFANASRRVLWDGFDGAWIVVEDIEDDAPERFEVGGGQDGARGDPGVRFSR